MTALLVGAAFFISINLFFWGAFYVLERWYDRHLERQLSRQRHPAYARTYPISNVKVLP